jgi:hypothetical protein
MEVASQGRVGPQGGGEATVFDTSAFFQNVYNMQKDLYARQEKKKQEIDQQNATWNAYLDDMPDVWQSDYEYVNKALNEYNDYIIDLKTQGLDPDALDPTIMKKIKELQNKVAKESSRAKDNETYSNQSFQLLNNDKANKYNKDYATKWLQDYGDPNKTPEQRAKMRIESNPFKMNYNMIEFIDDTIPKEEVVDTGRLKTTSRNKDAHQAVVFDYITNDQMGRDMYESLKKPNEDEKMFAERVALEGQKRYPVKQDRQVAPQPRETKDDKFKGGYGTGNWNDKLSMAYEKDPSYANTTKNKITITRTGTNDNLPAISIKDDEGKLIEFQPSSFYLRDDGKISVQGFKKDALGKLVPAWVSYDANKDVFKSQALGYDIEEEFRKLNNPTSTPPTGASTGNTGGMSLAEQMRANAKK